MTANKPRISIVLPTYNGERYLAQAIQSVIAQTCTDWELLIVDDGSTDTTPQIIAAYARHDPRLRPVRHPQNKNLPSALNTGFEQAHGTYHTWLSDDNYLRPHALQTLADYLDAHPEIGLVYSHYTKLYSPDEVYQLEKRLPAAYLPLKNVILPSFLHRAELFTQAGGYRADFFLAEDYDFFLRAREYADFALLDADLQVYRFHAAMLTHTAARHKIDDAVQRALLDSLHYNWTQQYDTRAKLYWHLARLAQRHQQYGAWLRYGAHSLRYSPAFGLRRGAVLALQALMPDALWAKLSTRYRRIRGI